VIPAPALVFGVQQGGNGSEDGEAGTSGSSVPAVEETVPRKYS